MHRIRAVGFDLGETLVTYAEAPLNWASLYRPALQRVASALQLQPSTEQFGSAEKILMRFNTRLNPRTDEVSAQTIFTEALATWAPAPGPEMDTAVAAFFSFFQQSLRVYEDALGTLETLKADGLRVGVFTDVPYGMPRNFVARDLEQTQLTPVVDVLLTSVEVGFRKPAREGFDALAAALGHAPSEIIYIGNEPKDIAGANAAGMTSVLIDREGLAPPLGQTHTMHTLDEIVHLIRASAAE